MKFEMIHEVTLTYHLGYVEAKSLSEAKEKADREMDKLLPMSREDYQENEEIIVSEV